MDVPEEVHKWVVELLKTGYNTNRIKKKLEEYNYDPKIVDEVLKMERMQKEKLFKNKLPQPIAIILVFALIIVAGLFVLNSMRQGPEGGEVSELETYYELQLSSVTDIWEINNLIDSEYSKICPDWKKCDLETINHYIKLKRKVGKMPPILATANKEIRDIIWEKYYYYSIEDEDTSEADLKEIRPLLEMAYELQLLVRREKELWIITLSKVMPSSLKSLLDLNSLVRRLGGVWAIPNEKGLLSPLKDIEGLDYDRLVSNICIDPTNMDRDFDMISRDMTDYIMLKDVCEIAFTEEEITQIKEAILKEYTQTEKKVLKEWFVERASHPPFS